MIYKPEKVILYLKILVFDFFFFNLNCEAQIYNLLLSRNQKSDLISKRNQNKGITLFSYEVDTNLKVCFEFEFNKIRTEYLLEGNKKNKFEYVYFKNKNIKQIKEWKNGILNGYFFEYDSMKNIMSCGKIITMYSDSIFNVTDTTFNNASEISIVGYKKRGIEIKDGTWKYYNKTGDCIKSENWFEGK